MSTPVRTIREITARGGEHDLAIYRLRAENEALRRDADNLQKLLAQSVVKADAHKMAADMARDHVRRLSAELRQQHVKLCGLLEVASAVAELRAEQAAAMGIATERLAAIELVAEMDGPRG